MVQIKWSKHALQDLREIHDFIAKDSPHYAKLQVEKIRESISNLAIFPNIGHNLPEFPESPYQEILCGNYRIIYRLEKDQTLALIMSIIHSRRLLKES